MHIRKQWFRQPVIAIVLLAIVGANTSALGQAKQYRKGIIATVQPLATDAGVAAFESGGNAVDAAISAALMLGVVDGHNSGIGGGCFILIRKANGEVIAIDGRETAPARATRDMFLRDGKAVPSLSRTGPLAVATPGAFAAYDLAVTKHGRLGSMKQALLRAATTAEDGFKVDRIYAKKLAQTKPDLERFPASKKQFLKPDGSAPVSGETVRLPDLAKTYRHLAQDGSDWFYRGTFAEAVGEWMKQQRGELRETDFASYAPKMRVPIRSSYRGYTILGFPPPSSGGIHVAQILNILEHFDMQALLRKEPATAHHIIAEAMRLALADRAHWLGDADFAKVPRGLVDKAYARELATRISPDKVTVVNDHGLPPNWQSDVYGKHTTHIAAADAEGNWVAITQTVNTAFGSKVVVPGTGVVLNNEMDDFSAQPGVPNAFGLVGTEANCVAPGKRPLSSMSPTIVLKDGQPIMSVGAAGGPKIITSVLLAIVRTIDGGQSVEASVADPRIHHQWRPNRLFVESSLEPDWMTALRNKGHQLEVLKSNGTCQAVAKQKDGHFVGIADPRVPGKVSGY